MLIVPIRHHSPAAALQVERLIRERRPHVVLVEGPSDASDLIDLLVDPATEPPVALYAYRRVGDHVRAVFYPLCTYSPEYVALRTGREVGAAVRFCDLPAAVTLNWEHQPATEGENRDDRADAADVDGAKQEGESAATDQPAVAVEEPAVAHDEPAPADYATFADTLAERAGFDDFEALWEAEFEQAAGRRDPAGYVELLGTFGASARAFSASRRGGPDARREQAMAEAAWEFRARGIPDDAILLVCGAAHAEPIADAYRALSEAAASGADQGTATTAADAATRDAASNGGQHVPTGAEPAPTSNAARPSASGADAARAGADTSDATAQPAEFALVPYSYPRLSEQAGYGAGNRAPWFYQLVWDLCGDYAGATRRALVVAARHLRERGYAASPAQAIDAYALATTLAQMRDKLEPGVDELVDAARACFGQGKGDLVGEALRDVLIGDRVGRITGRVGRTPLQAEFYATLGRLHLPALDAPKQVLVHLVGNPVEAEQSVFLHRLVACGIPFAHEVASGLRGTVARDPLERLGRVREKWELQWTPSTDAALIERTAWGSTLAEACARLLGKRLDAAARVDEGTDVLLQLAVCDLTGSARFTQALERCEALAADSGSFAALARAAYHLDGLLQYGAARALPTERLHDLAARLFARCLVHLPSSAACGDEQAEEVRGALASLHELVGRGSSVAAPSLDRFWEVVEAVAERPATHPSLRGVALVLLELDGRLGRDQLGERLRYWLSAATDAGDNARLVAGLFSLHRATLVRNRALVGAVTDFLLELDLDALTPLLPILRRGLGGLQGIERTYLSETLAATLGLDAGRASRALALASTDLAWLREADREIAATLADWKERYGIGA